MRPEKKHKLLVDAIMKAKLESNKRMILIRKAKDEHGWLGNMAAFPITWKEQTYHTSEALFQAFRFYDELEQHKEIMELIRAEKNPMKAKMIAKNNQERMVVVPKSPKDLENMELVIGLKIEQHPELKEKLLETDDAIIIEDVSNRAGVFKEYALEQRHTFWGMACRDGVWFGNNEVGKIWMKFREKLKNE